MTIGLLVVLVVPTFAIALTRSDRVRHLVMGATMGHVALGSLGLYAPSLLDAPGQVQLAGLAIWVYGWGVASAVFTAACTGVLFRRLFRPSRELELEDATARGARVGFGIAALVDVATVSLVIFNTISPFLEVSA